MGDALLAKETLALPDIVEILGPRPYPMKESIREYLEELKTRSFDEEAFSVKQEEKKAAEEEANNPTPPPENQ